jgi:hypothetical protein
LGGEAWATKKEEDAVTPDGFTLTISQEVDSCKGPPLPHPTAPRGLPIGMHGQDASPLGRGKTRVKQSLSNG